MEETSVAELAVRLVLSLGVVLGLMLGAAALLRRRNGAPARSGGGSRAAVEVLGRQSIGRNANVTVIRLGERALVLGVTEQQVTKLADVNVDDIELVAPRRTRRDATTIGAARTPLPGDSIVSSPSAWKGFVEALRERTVRR